LADRRSASIFEFCFKHLAKNPTNENKQFAKELFKKSFAFDFSHYQLYSDDELKVLNLARDGIHKDYPKDGTTIIYYPFDNLYNSR